MSKQYNYCLDFVKGIACIFVVLMHCEFPGILGTAIQAISRFCVPLFFMVSGYFCFRPEIMNVGGNIKFSSKIKHVLKITINACLFYSVFVFIASLSGMDVCWTTNKKNMFNWAVLNAPGWAGVPSQYWFLFALLYTYIFYSVIARLGLVKKAYWLAGFMFVAYVILAQGMHILGHHVPNMIYRNWLVEGFAYFMLGHWIHHHQDKLKFDNKWLLSILAISTILCWIERYFMGRDFGVNIVTIPQVFCLFLYAVNNPTKHQGIIQEIGKRYSMFVYILHPAVWHSLEMIYEKVGVADIMPALYLMPILVVILTLLFAHILYTLNLRFNSRTIQR